MASDLLKLAAGKRSAEGRGREALCEDILGCAQFLSLAGVLSLLSSPFLACVCVSASVRVRVRVCVFKWQKIFSRYTVPALPSTC